MPLAYGTRIDFSLSLLWSAFSSREYSAHPRTLTRFRSSSRKRSRLAIREPYLGLVFPGLTLKAGKRSATRLAIQPPARLDSWLWNRSDQARDYRFL